MTDCNFVSLRLTQEVVVDGRVVGVVVRNVDREGVYISAHPVAGKCKLFDFPGDSMPDAIAWLTELAAQAPERTRDIGFRGDITDAVDP